MRTASRSRGSTSGSRPDRHRGIRRRSRQRRHVTTPTNIVASATGNKPGAAPEATLRSHAPRSEPRVRPAHRVDRAPLSAERDARRRDERERDRGLVAVSPVECEERDRDDLAGERRPSRESCDSRPAPADRRRTRRRRRSQCRAPSRPTSTRRRAGGSPGPSPSTRASSSRPRTSVPNGWVPVMGCPVLAVTRPEGGRPKSTGRASRRRAQARHNVATVPFAARRTGDNPAASFDCHRADGDERDARHHRDGATIASTAPRISNGSGRVAAEASREPRPGRSNTASVTSMPTSTAATRSRAVRRVAAAQLQVRDRVPLPEAVRLRSGRRSRRARSAVGIQPMRHATATAANNGSVQSAPGIALGTGPPRRLASRHAPAAPPSTSTRPGRGAAPPRRCRGERTGSRPVVRRRRYRRRLRSPANARGHRAPRRRRSART